MNISHRVSQLKKSAIHEMTRLSKQVEGVAFLSWAKPTSGTPDHINQAAIEAIQKNITGGYSQSDGIPELRNEIARKLLKKNKINANPNEIIVTIGAIEGLAASIMATIDPGDEVILPTPTYSTHITQVRLASGNPVLVPLQEKNQYQLDIAGIKNAITPKTKAIVFCTPSNPTGTVFSEEDLRALAALALDNNLTIITDEAYEYFTFDNIPHFSIGSIPEMRKNTISCFTFTKTYAMTGWRIGYLHADEERISQIKKAHIPFAICAPVVSQFAALGALQGSQKCIDQYKNHYEAARNLMCERLDRIPHIFSYIRPQGSYLMFPKIETDNNDSFAFCVDLLQNARVSTTPGVAFGPNGEGHVRMSFCVPLETINKAFDRIEAYFNPPV